MKTLLPSGYSKICEFEDGLKVTPGHPVMYQGEWRYPREIVQPRVCPCDAVYNMVLDKDHIVYINDIPLILFGHNYTEGILSHPYLGSQAIVEDLQKLPGWTEGLIEVNEGWMTKDERGLRKINLEHLT